MIDYKIKHAMKTWLKISLRLYIHVHFIYVSVIEIYFTSKLCYEIHMGELNIHVHLSCNSLLDYIETVACISCEVAE